MIPHQSVSAAQVVSEPRERNVGTLRRWKSNGAAARWGYSRRHPPVFCSLPQPKAWVL